MNEGLSTYRHCAEVWEYQELRFRRALRPGLEATNTRIKEKKREASFSGWKGRFGQGHDIQAVLERASRIC